jgi:5'-3' exonuclease
MSPSPSTPGDTWRHAEFPAYKATRDAMPDDMRTQMTRIETLLRAFNIPIITYPNFEADDILGTLARQAQAAGLDVLVMTGDRDMFQLVDDHIKILYTSGGPNPVTSAYGLDEVQARYGLTPQQFIDFKALTGDASDNIPGVPGVGEKTAIKFLQQFGTIDDLYQHLDAISGPKTRQALIDAQAQVTHNRSLVTISTDLDLSFDPAQCATRDYDQDAVIALFEELEFRSLIKELPASSRVTPMPAAQSDTEGGQMALFAASETAAPDAAADPGAGRRAHCADRGRPGAAGGVGDGAAQRRTHFLRCRDDRHRRHVGDACRAGVGVGAGSSRLHPCGAHRRGTARLGDRVRRAAPDLQRSRPRHCRSQRQVRPHRAAPPRSRYCRRPSTTRC